MSYRQEHPYGFYSVIAICIVVAISVVSFFTYKTSIVNADAIKQVTEIQEREATERTEERSQFWQKVIPWGSDEAEVNE